MLNEQEMKALNDLIGPYREKKSRVLEIMASLDRNAGTRSSDPAAFAQSIADGVRLSDECTEVAREIIKIIETPELFERGERALKVGGSS